MFWKRIGGIESIDGEYHEIMLHDAQEITNSIFDLLPNPTDLDEEAIQVILEITVLRSTFAYQLLATLKKVDFPCFTFEKTIGHSKSASARVRITMASLLLCGIT